jgi:hypothetical protein
VDGEISADGGPGLAGGSGGGSGGSVRITATRMTGAGTISADGGMGHLPSGGGGGGGRIAIRVIQGRSADFSGIVLSRGGFGVNSGGAGTIILEDSIVPMQLIVDNGDVAGTNTPLTGIGGLSSITVRGKARLQASVMGTIPEILVGANSELLLGNPLTVLRSAIIETGGRINADGAGNGPGVGPGAGRAVTSGTNVFGGGGGHGGMGGSSRHPQGFGGGDYETQTGLGSGGGGITSSYSTRTGAEERVEGWFGFSSTVCSGSTEKSPRTAQPALEPVAVEDPAAVYR